MHIHFAHKQLTFCHSHYEHMLRNTVMPEQVVLLKNIHSRDIFLRGTGVVDMRLIYNFRRWKSVFHFVTHELNDKCFLFLPLVSPNGSFKLMTVLNTVENEIQCCFKDRFSQKAETCGWRKTWRYCTNSKNSWSVLGKIVLKWVSKYASKYSTCTLPVLFKTFLSLLSFKTISAFFYITYSAVLRLPDCLAASRWGVISNTRH